MKRKKPIREFTYKGFRNRYGKMTFKDRLFLRRLGIIEIFQQGYRGHACCHDKKIRVRSFTRLNMYVNYLRAVKITPWLNKKPEFADYEKTDAYFRKAQKQQKTKLLQELKEVAIQEVARRPISRTEFYKISKTIRGGYEPINDYINIG